MVRYPNVLKEILVMFWVHTYIWAPMDPKQHRYFFTKIMSTVPLLNRFMPFFACGVNGLSVAYLKQEKTLLFSKMQAFYTKEIWNLD